MFPLALRPTREHVLPALVVLFPAEWFVLRSVGTAAVRQGPLPVRELVVGSLGALAAAYLASVVVVSTVRVADVSPTGLPAAAFDPSDRTLAVLGVVLAGAAGYFLASLFVTVRGLPGTVLAAVGLPFGLPLVLTYAASVAVTNATGVGGGTAAVVVGLAASAVWTFGLAAALGDLLGRLGRGERADGEDSRDPRTR